MNAPRQEPGPRWIRRGGRRLVFTGVLIVLVLGGLELTARHFILRYRARFPFVNPRPYLLGPRIPPQMPQMFSAELGWDLYFTNTPYGERPRPRDYHRVLAMSFGDSFAFCAEVESTQTWQVAWSDLVQGDILNFGVGGYATDQAYLRFRRVAQQVRPPVALMCLTSENINRLLNVYRPFYYPKTAIRMTKPRFMLAGNGLKLLPNAITDPAQFVNLNNEAWLQRLGKHDYWFNREAYPVCRFPYLRILFNRHVWRTRLSAKARGGADDVNPQPWRDLWRQDEPRALMLRILARFIAECRELGIQPVIVLLPHRQELATFYRDRQAPASVEVLREFTGQQDCPFVDGLAGMAAILTEEQEVPRLIGHHFTPAGNQRLARVLHEALLADERTAGFFQPAAETSAPEAGR